MKQLLSLLVLLFFNYNIFAQKVIVMEKADGVYKIPCTVNGAKMKFIFDTGASTVCISETMADYLYENDYLSKEDILGKGTSSVADGRIIDHILINLRDIEIEGMHLKNIKAVVMEGQKAPLLLGQSAIQELGRISLDGDRLIIESGKNNYDQKEIDKLIEQAKKYMDNKSYSAAIECYLKVEDNWGLSVLGLREFAFCYYRNYQYNDCLLMCKRWISEFESVSNDYDRYSIYGYMANSYYFGLQDYNEAILWFQKKMPLTKDKNIATYDKFLIAESYDELQRYSEAKVIYESAIKEECSNLGITISDVRSNKINEDGLGSMFHGYAYCCYKSNDNINGDELLILAAKCGSKLAIKDCEKYNLNYLQISNKLFE